MKAAVLAVLALVVVVPATRAGDAAPAPAGVVTVRFRNSTTTPVYLQATGQGPILWKQGDRTFATTSMLTPCAPKGGCDCFSTPPPLPTVHVLPPGGVLESSWDGRYFMVHGCTAAGAPSASCRCTTLETAAPGTYVAQVEGASGVQPAMGRPLPEVTAGLVTGAEPDPAAPRCRAEASFALSAAPRTVQADITCAAAPRQATPAAARD